MRCSRYRLKCVPVEQHVCRREMPGAMIVNLNQYRKKRRRAEADAQAAENRVRHGRDKEERAKTSRERERASKEIENKRLD